MASIKQKRSSSIAESPSPGDSPPVTPTSQTTLTGQYNASPKYWWDEREITYPQSEDWPDNNIYEYLISNAISVSPLHSKPNKHAKFCIVTNAKGKTFKVTAQYHIPMIFLSKYQWNSLKQVMRAPNRQELWEDLKLSILYLAQLCNLFLEHAKNAKEFLKPAAYNVWRDSCLDHSLFRYSKGILVNKEETIRNFWMMYDEMEYWTNLEDIRLFSELFFLCSIHSLLPVTFSLARLPRCCLSLLPSTTTHIPSSLNRVGRLGHRQGAFDRGRHSRRRPH
jgi:hypothetical protein